jgi:hypothetical protein
MILFLYFFLFEYWGVESILGPLGTAATPGLLYLPRVIVRMEKLVEWTLLAGETEVLGENLSRRHFVHHKARTRAAAVGSQRQTAWAMGRPYDYLCCSFLSLFWFCLSFSSSYFLLIVIDKMYNHLTCYHKYSYHIVSFPNNIFL